MSTPDWEAILNAWPLIAAIAALWARLEVARAVDKNEARHLRRELEKLETQITDEGNITGNQAVQLGKIEEALDGIAATLERLEERIDGSRP